MPVGTAIIVPIWSGVPVKGKVGVSVKVSTGVIIVGEEVGCVPVVVGVDVPVAVPVGEPLAIGEAVPVGVTVIVPVDVPVEVPVIVPVTVPVGVEVLVGVSEEDCWKFSPCWLEPAAKARPPINPDSRSKLA